MDSQRICEPRRRDQLGVSRIGTGAADFLPRLLIAIQQGLVQLSSPLLGVRPGGEYSCIYVNQHKRENKLTLSYISMK